MDEVDSVLIGETDLAGGPILPRPAQRQHRSPFGRDITLGAVLLGVAEDFLELGLREGGGGSDRGGFGGGDVDVRRKGDVPVVSADAGQEDPEGFRFVGERRGLEDGNEKRSDGDKSKPARHAGEVHEGILVRYEASSEGRLVPWAALNGPGRLKAEDLGTFSGVASYIIVGFNGIDIHCYTGYPLCG